ncbi:MAG TPA: MmcQ/YjbR family DNA-binding protein [Steroidobacteraceae bacterium]|jgi:hypothetical protein|nr:MmcQ/YjbR family DNA-binding protein [Steroidobacteraceae bacterium]
MSRKPVDFDAVREIALALPDVEESSGHGATSLKVRGKLLACPAIHKSAEPYSMVVKVGFDQRAGLIATDPDIYYVTAHYVNYPSVLVRMSRIRRDALRDLLGLAWQFVSDQTKSKTRTKTRIKRRSGVVQVDRE